MYVHAVINTHDSTVRHSAVLEFYSDSLAAELDKEADELHNPWIIFITILSVVVETCALWFGEGGGGRANAQNENVMVSKRVERDW